MSSSTLTLRYGANPAQTDSQEQQNTQPAPVQPNQNYNQNSEQQNRFDAPRLHTGNLLSRGNQAAVPSVSSSHFSSSSQVDSDDEDDCRVDNKRPVNGGKTLELKFLKTKSAESLIEVAKEYGLDNIGDYGRQDIIYHILKNFSDQNPWMCIQRNPDGTV